MTISMMIDLETLGTSSRAILLQLGWTIFDTEGAHLIESREMNMSITDCVKHGGDITEASVLWWLQQSEAARLSVSGGYRYSLLQALTYVKADWSNFDCQIAWSHGDDFDLKIMEHYFHAIGAETPWRFWATRDTRTLFDIAEFWGWERPRVETAHTAMADSDNQAMDVQAAMSHMRRIREKSVHV